MKGVFGMRRAHVRRNQAVHNEIGLMLMSMKLTKLILELRRKGGYTSKSSEKGKKNNENRRFSLFFFCFLRAGFFPAPLFFKIKTVYTF